MTAEASAQLQAAEIRASYAKTFIGAAKRLPGDDAEALLARVGKIRRKRVRQYGMLEWMPAGEFLELVDEVPAALGPAGAREFWKRCLALSLGRRLLAPLRLGAVALHGHTPAALLRMTPQAWHLVSRRCGVCDVDVGADNSSLVLKFSGLPPEYTERPQQYLWEGGCLACIDMMECQGDATGTRVDAETVHIRVVWSGAR